MIGGVLILAGSLITQRRAGADGCRRMQDTPAVPLFAPRYLAGYLFASFAASPYGTTPDHGALCARAHRAATGILGGLIAYVAATAVASLALLSPQHPAAMFLRFTATTRRWFALSGVFVAAAQGFFFAAVAVAPVMLVMPLLQLSLAFRMLFSTWLNPAHEIVGPLVLAAW